MDLIDRMWRTPAADSGFEFVSLSARLPTSWLIWAGDSIDTAHGPPYFTQPSTPCTYRAGFEPIRDLPSLAFLPPPLGFPAPPPSLSYNASMALAEGAATLAQHDPERLERIL